VIDDLRFFLDVVLSGSESPLSLPLRYGEGLDRSWPLLLPLPFNLAFVAAKRWVPRLVEPFKPKQPDK
jgi:hypothetical protein